MVEFVPIEKWSKKKQREYHRKQRGTFEQMGCQNPITRIIPDKKHRYDRAKFKKEGHNGT